MKRDRRPSEALLKHGRKQMLAGMLLHVIEAARPIDAAKDVRAAGAPVNYVNYFVAVVADIENIRVTDFPQVVRLAARGGIERSTIQNQPQDGSRDSGVHVRRQKFTMHDTRLELLFECIVVIKAACRHKS